MNRMFLKKSIISVLSVFLVLSGCGQQADPEPAPVEEPPAGEETPTTLEGVPDRFAGGEGAKIRVIRKIGGDDHTAQFLSGAKEEGESMGFTVDVFTANGDTAKFHDAISQTANQDYDGVIISHGDDAATVDNVEQLRNKGMEVVAFDSVSELQDIEGVTLTSQDDEALAELALNELVEDTGGEANIVYLWVDGFPPMVRRNNVYQRYLQEHEGLNELERFGVAAADTTVQTQNAVAAMLNKYPKGELDAIFATWDAFAIGAARAIKEAGRDEIKIYGIDVSNADLQIMQEEGSPWVATAAVDPKLVGAVNMRILTKKLAGEETPKTFDLEPSLIRQEDLQQSDQPVNMVNLGEIIEGWGVTEAFLEDWMEQLKQQ